MDSGKPEPGSVAFFRSSKSTRISETTKKQEITYQITKNHPHHLRAVPVSQIIKEHRAPHFLTAVKKYLQEHECTLEPRFFDDFKLFLKIGLELPEIPEVSRNKWRDAVHATPPSVESGRRKAEPAYLNFALVRTGEPNTHTDGTNLQGKTTVLECS